MKIIRVSACSGCPHNGGCKAWKRLNSAQRVNLTFGVGVPHDFILKDCPLDDDPDAETNEQG